MCLVHCKYDIYAHIYGCTYTGDFIISLCTDYKNACTAGIYCNDYYKDLGMLILLYQSPKYSSDSDVLYAAFLQLHRNRPRLLCFLFRLYSAMKSINGENLRIFLCGQSHFLFSIFDCTFTYLANSVSTAVFYLSIH
jgi:hypothetical protein